MSSILVGLFLFVQLLYVNHYFRPTNYTLWLFSTIFVVFIIILNRSRYSKIYKTFRANSPSKIKIFFVFLVQIISVIRLGDVVEFDDSLVTHIPLEKIFMEQRIPVGIGNIDPYMAFGTPIQIISASLHLFNGVRLINLLLLFILLFFILELTNVRSFDYQKNIIYVFFILFTFIIALGRPTFWLNSPNYDLPTLIIFGYCLFYMLKTIPGHIQFFLTGQREDDIAVYNIVLYLVFSILFSIRMNLIFLILLYYFIVVFKFKLNIFHLSNFKHIFILPLPYISVSIEKFLMTGYPIYPFTFIRIDMQWTMPHTLVEEKMGKGQLAVAFKEMARGAFYADYILNLTIFLCFLVVLQFVFSGLILKLSIEIKILLSILFLNLIFWWFTIPVIRYAWPSLIGISSILCYILIKEAILENEIFKSKFNIK